MKDLHYIGSWTISCGHGLGTESASKPLHVAIGAPEPYQEIVPSAKYPHEVFEDKLAEIMDVTPRLREEVRACLAKEKKVVVLGGDHSIALGSVAGTLAYDENAAVIWFDAHGDVNTEETSPSGNIHGMPVAALLGLCASGLNTIANPYLKPTNIFWIGVRDLDEGEKMLAKQFGLTMFSAQDVRQLGMAEVMRQIAERLKQQKVKTLHLSFDIDGMDPSIVAATGTAVPDGLTQVDFEELVRALSSDEMPELRVLDFVEYNPAMDAEGKTLRWCKEALRELIKVM